MPATPSPVLCAEPAAAPAADAPQKSVDPVIEGLTAKLQALEAKQKQLGAMDAREQQKSGHDIKAAQQRLRLQIAEIRQALGANPEATK